MTKASVARRSGPRDVTYVTMPHNTVAATDRPRRGETIRQFVTRTGWEARGLPVVCARRTGTDMQPILRAEWGRKIKPSDELVFIAMPRGGGAQGGGSRSMAGLAAMIAVIALATVVAGPAGFLAGAGFGKVALAVTSAVIIAGGSALVSHFLSPKAGAEDKSEKDPLSVSFGGNQARPQQPIPVRYGREKFFPDFASAPWTDFRGKDQVFHGLYSLGVGEFEIHEIGFGTTPVWTAGAGTSPDFPSFEHEIVPPGEPVTLFPSNVAVSADVSGQQLETVNEYIGPFIINSPGTLGKRLAIDLIWPGGSHWTSKSGRVDPLTTSVRVQYRYVDGSGVPINSTWVTAADLTYRFLSKVAERKTAIINLPTSGRVQVRATRTNPLITDNGTNAVVWSGARLYLEGSETRPHVTLMAMEAVSDKSLSAYGSQQIYVIATRKIPVWTGTEWVDQATQNPIWAAVDFWHNAQYGGGQSRNNIDLPRMAQLAAEADARGDTFNGSFTEEMTVLEAIEAVLRPMIAQPVYVWDRLSVIRDADERVAPRLLLTDFEIIRGSFSGDWNLQDNQTSDGVIVEYLEEETWLRAEVSSSGSVATLTHPSRVQVPGVTNRRQATLLARYLAASNRYRRMTASMEIEAEGKLLRRGDLVVVQTELPQTWGQAFRIDESSVVLRSLTFHEAADWTGGPNFYVFIRTPTGVPFGPVKVTQGASPEIAIIDQTDLVAVQNQQGMTLAEVLDRSETAERPTAAFSEGEPRSFYGLVTRVGNAGEGRFTLDLVRDEPEMYDIDDADVPPLPPAPVLFLPAVPGAVSDIVGRVEQEGASLALYVSWEPALGAQTYTAQISLIDEAAPIVGEPGDIVPTDPQVPITEADRTWTTVYPNGYETTFQVSGLPDNDHYLRIRGTSADGANGPWSVVTVESPGLDLSPGNLGVQIEYADLTENAKTQIEGDLAAAKADLEAAIAQVQADLNALDTTTINQLNADIDAAQASIDAALADVAAVQAELDALTTETIDAINADIAALQGDVATITTTVASLQTSTADNSAAITNEIAARADADTALAGQFNTVQTQTNTNTAAISSEALARTNADSALSGRIDTVTSTTDANAAAITAEAVTRANADSSLSSQITTVNAAATRQRVFRQSSAPTAQVIGDVWVDTANGNSLKYWSGTAWVAVDNTALATNSAAIQTEATARATADSAQVSSINSLTTRVGTAETAITTEATSRTNADNALSGRIDTITARAASKVFRQSTTPTAGGVGDLWIDTTNNTNALKFWNGSAWIATDNATISANTARIAAEEIARANADTSLASQITTVSATASRQRVWRQGTAPTAQAIGDIWVDTANGNALKYWSGSAWVLSDNTALATNTAAITSEATTRANADSALSTQITSVSATASRQRVFRQTSAPTAQVQGDIWIDTANGNSLKYWSGTAWVASDNAALAANAAAITAEQTARINADGALTTQVNTAQSAATRQRVWRQATAPTAQVAGDVWIDTANGNSIKYWSGSAWVVSDNAALATNTAAITTEATTRATEDAALSGRIDTVTATAGANTARIATEEVTRANADSALSGRIDTISAQAAGGFDAIRAWQYDTGLESWTGTNGAPTAANGIVTQTSTTTVPMFVSPASLGIVGAQNTIVRVRLRRTAGASWRGRLYYATPGHAMSGLFYKDIAVPFAANNEWVIAEWDMTTLTAGGADWTASTINQLRFDFFSAASNTIEVDWIAIGRAGPVHYRAAVTDEALARATEDTALSNRITTVEASSARARIYRQLTVPASPVIGDMWVRTSDNKHHVWSGSEWVDSDPSQIETNRAAIVTEQTARANADTAISQQVTTVEAKANAGTAEGRIAYTAVAGVGSVAAEIYAQVKATPSGSFLGSYGSASWRMQAMTDGTSRHVFKASQFIIESGATNFQPFAVINNEIVLNGVTRVANILRSDAVNTAGVPFLQQDFPNGRIIISDNT